MKLNHFAALVVSVVSFTAFAQPKAAPAAAKPAEMPIPQLPAEGKKWLEGHLGNRKASDAVLTMGGQSMKGKMEIKCEKTSSGWAVVCRGKVTFLMGWNIGDGTATMFEVSNMGETHNHTGKWLDDKSIALAHQGKTWEGKEEKDVVTFTWNSPKEMVIKAEGTAGTATTWTMSATAKK